MCVCGMLETQQQQNCWKRNLGVCYLGVTHVRITDWKSLCLNLDTSQHDTDVCSLKGLRMEQEVRMARRCSVVVRLPLAERNKDLIEQQSSSLTFSQRLLHLASRTGCVL